MKLTDHKRGFMLLEMVIAVGLLVLGMAVLGAQIRDSSELSQETDELARVVFLAESKIAELDTGLIQPAEEIKEDFGRLFPEYAWRMTIVPGKESQQNGGQDSDLNVITLEILRDRLHEIDTAFDFENARVVHTFYTLRATPRPVNLITDFGLDEEQAQNINDNLADIGETGINVEEFSPGLFRDLDIEQIVQMLPVLMAAFNVDQSQLMDLLPPEVRSGLEDLLNGLTSGGASETGGGAGEAGGSEAGDGGNDRGGDKAGGGNRGDGGSRGGDATDRDTRPGRDGSRRGDRTGRGDRNGGQRQPGVRNSDRPDQGAGSRGGRGRSTGQSRSRGGRNGNSDRAGGDS